MIANQNELTAASGQRNQDGRLSGLRGFVDEDAFEGHTVNDITARPDASTADDLRILDGLSLLLEVTSRHSAATASTFITARAIDAVPEQLGTDGLGTAKTNDSQSDVGASFHKVINCNVRITRGEDRIGGLATTFGLAGSQTGPVLEDSNGHGCLTGSGRSLNESEPIGRGALDGKTLTAVQAFESAIFLQRKTSRSADGIGIVSLIIIFVVIVLLIGGVERHSVGAQGGGTGELIRGVSPSDIATGEHAVLDVLVHRCDGLDELARGASSVLQGLLGSANKDGRCELAIEAHAVGKLVDTVDVTLGVLGQQGVQTSVGLVLETKNEVASAIDRTDGCLNHVPIKRFR